MTGESKASKRILMMHLDLGIGGAENLVVQIACSLKKIDYEVDLYTTHHDPNHCFEETKPNGILGKNVHVYGDSLPRNIQQKLTAFFAVIRMLFLALVVITHFKPTDCEAIIVDGVSAPVPLLRWFGFKVIFYCHFPDLLLCTDRSSVMKKLYRLVMDGVEAQSTAAASLILVNSGFTSEVFKETFPVVYRNNPPQILYPVVPILPLSENKGTLKYCADLGHVFFSLNRYERKKKIEIALDAFKYYKAHCASSSHPPLLVVAGGYDKRVKENIEYLYELFKYCEKIRLTYRYLSEREEEGKVESTERKVDVIFRTSISAQEREELFSVAKGLLYTPDNEHFGIVPIEAMMQETAVIAVNSGGPVESIVDNKTGFLCTQEGQAFGQAMLKLVEEEREGEALYKYMGKKARLHVIEKFSEKAMEKQLKHYLLQLKQMNHTS